MSARRCRRTTCAASRSATGRSSTRGVLRREGHRAAALDAGPGDRPRRPRAPARGRREILAYSKLLLAPAPSPGPCRCPAQTSTASTTCACSRTPMPSARRSSAAGAPSRSGPAGSAPRSPRPRARRGMEVTHRRAARGPARARARAARWARSTPASTGTTASRCWGRPASRRSRATGRVERVRLEGGRTLDCDFVDRRRRRHAARGAGGGRRPRDRQRRSSSTSASRPRPRACSPPATSPTPGTRSSSAACASSTGTTRSSRARRPPATCSAGASRTTRIPYFFSDQYDVGMEYAGLRHRVGRGRLPRRRRGPRVHRLLAAGRARRWPA